jgi:hypothetical protein
LDRISAALQRTKGRIWPFGWITLLREPKRIDWLINGAGLIQEYRGLGGTAILFRKWTRSMHSFVAQLGAAIVAP